MSAQTAATTQNTTPHSADVTHDQLREGFNEELYGGWIFGWW